MLEKKNIDRVFQENLKDLEIYPNKRVWVNIDRVLSNKSVKQPIALWKKMGGIAASFVALFSLGFYLFNTPEPQIQTIPVANTDSNQVIENTTPQLVPMSNNDEVQIANNESGKTPAKKEETPIFRKDPVDNVIVTDTEIATVYSNIENKYIIDKNEFLEELNDQESITARMESLPKAQRRVIGNEKKWSVGPTVAPVFYNTLQNGSPINEELSENSKASDNALSYGVKFNYQLSKKFFIQSGLNKVELAYNTKNVNAYITPGKNAYTNTNTNKPGVILSPAGRSSISGSEENTLNKSSLSGELNQSIEYFEFPVEMKYNLYDKKLGLNLVGGFSTLFLSDNSLSIVTDNRTTDLGNANNLNSFNFSGNVGVDLDYKISNSWYLNVAPMFKYQFNTYSGNSGNFRPYYFGLYSGLNYKF